MSACDELVGSPKNQVMRSQMIAPVSPPNTTAKVTILMSIIPAPTVLRDGRAERERRDEIEEGRPDDRFARRQHARRHDGGDRIRRVVETVDVVEEQRDADQAGDDGEHRRASRA